MRNRRLLSLIAVVILALAAPATALALKLSSDAQARIAKAAAAAMPASSTASAVKRIGALYTSSGTQQHDCTASVVKSPQGNTLITAAHCVNGNGKGMVFVPGAKGATAPYGRWTVTAVHVESAWISRQDPKADVAFLTVAPQTIKGKLTEIQSMTGAFKLGSTAAVGKKIRVTGYPMGTTNDPITCDATTYESDGYPAFNCQGYVAGTSGTPWLEQTSKGLEIVGVIGGLHQGGCSADTSYSSQIDDAVRATYRTAQTATSGDVAPTPNGDGC